MKQKEENQEKATRYLFGELDETERDAMEDRIFADDDFSLYLSAVEKDLVDDYVRGEMDADLRQRFERRYLISETRREKIRLASVLQTEVLTENFAEKEAPAPVVTEPKTSFWQPLADFFRVPNLALAGGLAVILLFVVLGGLILLRRAPRAPEIVRDSNANRQIFVPPPTASPGNRPVNENSNRENFNAAQDLRSNANQAPAATPENKAPEKPPTPRPTENRQEAAPPRIFVATLLPSTRGGEKPVLIVPKNAESVRFRVVHDNLQPFAGYRAEIRNQNGDLIFTRDIAVSEKNISRPLNLNVKASALPPGSYELTLSGVRNDKRAEEIKFYNFSVNKK